MHNAPAMEQTRRAFVANGCHALTLAALSGVSGAFSACGGGGDMGPSSVNAMPRISASVANGQVVMTIDANSPLNGVGSAALVQTSSGDLLVAHTGADTFSARTAICTHEQCTITGFENQRYTCPCHGSQYTTDGQVTRGPAPRALRSFATAFAGGTLTITV